jgi:signal transduction histidine kinase
VSTFGPSATKTPDGRLWFSTDGVVQMIDPAQLILNAIVPPVKVEALRADGALVAGDYERRIPPLTRQLQIDYAGLSFTVPQKVRFRYRLIGQHPQWVDAGGVRSAFFTDLRPGKYVFEVSAANNDGLWSPSPARLRIYVAAAWFQTLRFKALCVLAGLSVLAMLYRLRVRQISRQLDAKFEERLAERTRIARDLHDTVLQTIQGSHMFIDGVLDERTTEERRKTAMLRIQAGLKQAMVEVRAALNSLLTDHIGKSELPEAVSAVLNECSAAIGLSREFSVHGAVVPMHPLFRDEIYRVALEAIRNACAHSGASKVTVSLDYSSTFTLTVVDDGRGIDPALTRDGLSGHFGIKLMHDRASHIGARLSFESHEGKGTIVRLQLSNRGMYGARPQAKLA